MSSTAELKKVKLNITNIKSVLLDGKKAVDEKNKERKDFLTKLEEERKQRREEKAFEKPIDPNKKKPDLKSPVKSSMGLMDRIFTFVGAIVGGILVKALPEIIETFKKIYEAVEPFYSTMIEFWTPIFKNIIKIFSGKKSYEEEKEKVNSDIDVAKLEAKNIDDQVGELDKASDEIINENQGLGKNAKALGAEEKSLMEDPEMKDDDEDDDKTGENEGGLIEGKENENYNITAEVGNPATVVTKMVDGKEVVVTDMDESLKIQNEAKDLYKSYESGKGNVLDKVNDAEFTGVKVITTPVPPVREDFPKTAVGLRAYMDARKEYEIQYKEFKKSQENLINPSTKNNNGLNALNTTDGLTSVNGTGSKTIVLQRQIVQTNTVIPV
tara:strand:+ start:1486 stop:2634 length:1149 start_codon:yes stop_codon:yes gene_type:complete